MADRFSKSLGFFVPKGADFWDVAEAFAAKMRSTLLQVDGELRDGVTVTDVDGSTFERSTFRDARKALSDHDSSPKLVVYRVSVIGADSWAPVAAISVSAWFLISNVSNLDVEIASSNKLTLDGLSAAANAFNERIQIDPSPYTRGAMVAGSTSGHALQSQSDSSDLKPLELFQTVDGPTTAAIPPTIEAHLPETWWKRHGATSLIALGSTVVGGVLVGVVLKALGLV